MEELKQKLNWSSCALWNEKKKKNQLNIFNIPTVQVKILNGFIWIQNIFSVNSNLNSAAAHKVNTDLTVHSKLKITFQNKCLSEFTSEYKVLSKKAKLVLLLFSTTSKSQIIHVYSYQNKIQNQAFAHTIKPDIGKLHKGNVIH